MKTAKLLFPIIGLLLLMLGAAVVYGAFTGFGVKGVPENNEQRLLRARNTWGQVYADRMALFLEENPRIQKGGTVFLGDSLTHVFELQLLFPEENFINRGISGDGILGLIDRLDVCVEALEPSSIYVLIGTNDLWHQQTEAYYNEVMGNYRTLFQELQQRAPEAQITIQSLLPTTGETWSFRNAPVQAINPRLKILTEEFGFRWLDLHPHFADEAGTLRPELTFDGLHLTSQGYLFWANLIKPSEPMELLFERIAPQFIAFNSPVYSVTGINLPTQEGPYYPSPHELVIYNNDIGRNHTGTQLGQIEGIVQHNLVLGLSGHNSLIPENGFVISGHNRGFIWVVIHCKPGVLAGYDDQRVWVEYATWEEITPTERRVRLLVSAQLALQENSVHSTNLRVRVAQLLPGYLEGTPPDDSLLDDVKTEFEALGLEQIW